MRLDGLKQKIVVGVCIIVLFIVPFGVLNAQGPAQYIFETSVQEIQVNNDFSLDIYIVPNGEAINTARLELKFPPNLLSVESFRLIYPGAQVSPGNIIDNEKGILYQGGFFIKSEISKKVLFAKVIFKAKSAGEAIILQGKRSKLIANGQEKIDKNNQAEIKFHIKKSEGKQIIKKVELLSSSHPNQDNWSAKSDVSFNWKGDDILSAKYVFSKELNDKPYREIIDDKISFTDVEDGIWYFYLQAQLKDGKELVSQRVMIDTHPPQRIVPVVENKQILSGENAVIRFGTTDDMSGIDYYTVMFDGRNLGKQESPLTIKQPKQGKHSIVVLAIDKAGNMVGGETSFQVGQLLKEGKAKNKNIVYIVSIIILIIFSLLIIFKKLFNKKRH